MELEKAEIVRTKYNLETIRDKMPLTETSLKQKEVELVNNIDLWDIMTLLIKSPKESIKIIYYTVKIITIGKIMAKDKLTTLIGSIVALIATILTILGITIPPEISSAITPFLIAVILIVWKPKEK